MKKQRIYWPYGNPNFDAWMVEASAGKLVIRRNHPLMMSGKSNCQGWDVWLEGQYLGAIGSCALKELTLLSEPQLKGLLLSACCGKHKDFTLKPVSVRKSGWGGRRPNAGRPCKARFRRVDLATTVDQRTLEFIDQHRGATSRGEFIDLLVKDKMKD
jgi:hypothetical protein